MIDVFTSGMEAGKSYQLIGRDKGSVSFEFNKIESIIESNYDKSINNQCFYNHWGTINIISYAESKMWQ